MGGLTVPGWLYENWKMGILPQSPALNANPHKLVQCFRILSAAIAEANDERDTTARRKAQAAAKRAAALGRTVTAEE